MGGEKAERKRGRDKIKTKQSPPHIPNSQVFQQPDLGVQKDVLVWGGDVKATDFLTSPLPWLSTFSLCTW